MAARDDRDRCYIGHKARHFEWLAEPGARYKGSGFLKQFKYLTLEGEAVDPTVKLLGLAKCPSPL